MSLPKGWTITKLQELSSDISYGYTASSTTEKVGPRMLRITDIQNNQVDWDTVPYCVISDDKSGKYILCKDDLLFARTGATVGKSFLIRDEPPKAVYASYLIRVRTASSDLSSLLSHFFNSEQYWQQITEFSAGIGQPNVNGTKLKGLDIPLPPLAEQKVIADKLDSLLAQVETTKARLDCVPDILKRFRQSVLAAAVSGRLTEEWRESHATKSAVDLLDDLVRARSDILELEIKEGNKETKRLLTKLKKHKPNLPNDKLPPDWVWTSFMGSMERVVDCHNKTAPYVDSGIPLIRTPDIRNGKISLSGAKFIEQGTYDYWSRRCPPDSGDIIFTREAPMGEAGIVPQGVKLCMGQRMMLLRPMPEYVNPRYVLLNILSLNFQQRMNDQAIGTGVKHLRVADVESLTYPLAPLEEQTEIVRRVEELFAFADAVEQKSQAASERVNKLTQSILAKAFRGELTADWRAANPDLISGENSAEALLEKIKAEREALKPKKKTRAKKVKG